MTPIPDAIQNLFWALWNFENHTSFFCFRLLYNGLQLGPKPWPLWAAPSLQELSFEFLIFLSQVIELVCLCKKKNKPDV